MPQSVDDAHVGQQGHVLGLDAFDDDGDPAGLQFLGDLGQRVRAGGIEHADRRHADDDHRHLGTVGVGDGIRDLLGGTEEHCAVESEQRDPFVAALVRSGQFLTDDAAAPGHGAQCEECRNDDTDLHRLDQVEAGNPSDIKTLGGRGGSVDKAPFTASVEDYYLTNPIARASETFARLCSYTAVM